MGDEKGSGLRGTPRPDFSGGSIPPIPSGTPDTDSRPEGETGPAVSGMVRRRTNQSDRV